MRKKKQEMLKTQIECQKVKKRLHSAPPSPFPFPASLHFLLTTSALPLLPGSHKPAGEEPRDETWGEGQRHEDPEGADGEDRAAAEWNEPQPRLAGVQPQAQPRPAQDQDWCTSGTFASCTIDVTAADQIYNII